MKEYEITARIQCTNNHVFPSVGGYVRDDGHLADWSGTITKVTPVFSAEDAMREIAAAVEARTSSDLFPVSETRRIVDRWKASQ